MIAIFLSDETAVATAAVTLATVASEIPQDLADEVGR